MSRGGKSLDYAGLYCTLQYISSNLFGKGAMATAKTTTLTFRIEPRLKEALRTAAVREHRSIVNMVEVLIRDYCGRNGIAIPGPGMVPEKRQKRPSTK